MIGSEFSGSEESGSDSADNDSGGGNSSLKHEKKRKNRKKKALTDEAVAEIQAKIDSDRKLLAESKNMEEEERNRVAQQLQEHELELEKAQFVFCPLSCLRSFIKKILRKIRLQKLSLQWDQMRNHYSTCLVL